MPRTGARALAALVAAASLAAGCGGTGEPAAAPAAGASRGTLVIAVPRLAGELDPLLAASPWDALVARQAFEPLVERLWPPYGQGAPEPGLARRLSAARGQAEWRLRLRPGVRFQDGSLLSAGAVLANVRRWQTTAAGQRLLPGLVAADAPRPDVVRLFFSRPQPALPRLLASPRLGVVSPRALSPRSGEAARLVRAENAGTGPFELRERSASGLVLAANAGWWGRRERLGPALDQIQVRPAPSPRERLALLRSGEAQVAVGLPPGALRDALRDPLLTTARGAIALERSVRGLHAPSGAPSLASVWLTRIGAG